MRKHHRSVEDIVVDEIERAEIIFETMTDQDGVSVDETHQIILHFLDVLVLARCWNINQIMPTLANKYKEVQCNNDTRPLDKEVSWCCE